MSSQTHCAQIYFLDSRADLPLKTRTSSFKKLVNDIPLTPKWFTVVVICIGLFDLHDRPGKQTDIFCLLPILTDKEPKVQK